ncbi:MAG TPA: hypothetical protein DCF63_13955 [Planctomycetaceae bacterium]|nr:hypothetical protein [Planctomycetaceae bacterium]
MQIPSASNSVSNRTSGAVGLGPNKLLSRLNFWQLDRLQRLVVLCGWQAMKRCLKNAAKTGLS